MRGLRLCRLTGATLCRRCITAEVPPSARRESGDAAAPVGGMGFRSSTSFKLRPAQVNETNVPSAREVGKMLPTLRELQAQLPDARELERTYIEPGAAAADSDGAQRQPAASAAASLFEKTTDPLEDLLFGPPKEGRGGRAEAEDERQQPRQHLLLAYRALLWGTVLALAGFAATVAAAMYLCGYHSLRDLQQGVREKVDRDEERLRATAAAAVAAQGGVGGDTVVEHYVIDLAQPAEAWRQAQEIWTAVQRLAEEEERKEAHQQGTQQAAS